MERAEHLARYAKVQFVSALDAPFAQHKELWLSSVLNMSGVSANYEEQFGEDFTEDRVLEFIALNEGNPASVVSSVGWARENARSARALLSIELWEEINKYYHFVNNYGAQRLEQEGAYNFCQGVEQQTSTIRGYIDGSLPHNEVWLLISLGLHLERSVQISRIMLSKLYDIEASEKAQHGQAMTNYHVTTMLKSAESFDMSKRQYKAMPTLSNALEFLILNAHFPKSILFNLLAVREYVKKITLPADLDQKGTVSFHVGKVAHNYKYLTIEEVAPDPIAFINETLESLYKASEMLETQYLT